MSWLVHPVRVRGTPASPRLGPSLCWCLTELCGQVQGSQGSAAPARGSLLKASILVSCQPDGSGFSQAGALQSQAHWKVCAGKLTSFGVKPHSPKSGGTKKLPLTNNSKDGISLSQPAPVFFLCCFLYDSFHRQKMLYSTQLL